MKVMILAGGRGRRLGFLTRNTPKPMLKISKRPFLEEVILRLKRQGFRHFILLCGYHADRIRDYFQDGRNWKVRIQYSVESRPLGTAGAVRLAKRFLRPDENFLVLNGDTLLKTDFSKMIRFHRRIGADVTMAVSEDPERSRRATRFGCLVLDSDRRIRRYSEKATKQRSSLVNAGAYVLHPRVLRLIPPGRPYSLERQLFPKLVGRKFFGWPVRGQFIDIGTVATYRRAARARP